MNQNRIWHAIFFKLIIFFIVVSLSYQVLAKTDIDDNSSKIFKVSGKSLQQLADSSQDSGTGNEPLGMMKFKRKRPLNLENSLSEVTSKSCKALIKER